MCGSFHLKRPIFPPSATAAKKVPKKSPRIVTISAVKTFNLQKYLANCRVYLKACSIV